MEADVFQVQLLREPHVFVVGDALAHDLERDVLVFQQLGGFQDVPNAVERDVLAMEVDQEAAIGLACRARADDRVVHRQEQAPELAGFGVDDAAEMPDHVVAVQDGEAGCLVGQPVAQTVDPRLQRTWCGLLAVEHHGVVGRDVHVKHDRFPGQQADQRGQQLAVEPDQHQIATGGFQQCLQQQAGVVFERFVGRQAGHDLVAVLSQGAEHDAGA